MSTNPDVERITYWIRLLRQRNAEAVVRDFSPDLRAAMPGPLLQLSWDVLTKKAGAFERVLSSTTDLSGADHLVRVRCAFAQSVREVMLEVALDHVGRIRGFFGHILTRNTALTHARVPPYVNPGYFTERDVIIGHEPWLVGGTLTCPVWDGPFPGAVLVNTHRDRNGMGNIFRDLAWGLASNGVMVLRYDQSTVDHRDKDAYLGSLDGPGSAMAPPLTVQDEFLDDAVSALKRLCADPASNGHVFAVGHGLGAYLLPRLAEQYGGPLGFVSLFGHTRPAWQISLESVAHITAENPSHFRAAQRIQADLSRVGQGQYQDSERLAGQSGRYWSDLRDHHGRHRFAPDSPILAVHGSGDDTGGGIAEFERLKEDLRSCHRTAFVLYPDLSYWLKAIERGYDPHRGQRHSLQGPVDQRLIFDMARWIRTTPVTV